MIYHAIDEAFRFCRLVQSVGKLVVDTPVRSPLCGGSVPGRQGGVESSRSALIKLLNLLSEVGKPLLPFNTFPQFDA
jgi:hypothetical protein